MEINRDWITVCTPTYNRAYLLERPFLSLLNQTCKNFIWLVIDDGSTDDTASVIEQFKTRADFIIEYHRKENGGRHTALNYSYKYIRTEYVINLDSDDEYMPNTIADIIKIKEAIPASEYNRFWQISGRCIDSYTRQLIGEPYPDKINELSGKTQRKEIYKYPGEKSNCRKVDILRKNLFPIYSDTKFVAENQIWHKIDKYYDTYCVNNIFRVYFQDSEDSLANGKMYSESLMRTRYYYILFCVNELWEDQIKYNKEVQRSMFNLPRLAIINKISYREVMGSLNAWYKKFLVTILGYPIGIAYYLLNDRRRYQNDI